MSETQDGLPETVFVVREDEGDAFYLLAFKNVEEVTEDYNGQVAGVYELKRTGVVHISTSFKENE